MPDFREELQEFYRDCYHAELERKEKLLERVNLAAGFLTILGGILAYYTTSIESVTFRWIHLLFYVPYGAGGIATIVSMIYVAISITKGFGYAYIPQTTEVADYIKSAEAFNARVPDGQKVDIRAAFYENLSRQFCEYAAINWSNNTVRSGYIFTAIRWAVASMFIVVAAVPGFIVLKKDFQTPPTEIKVLNPIEVKP